MNLDDLRMDIAASIDIAATINDVFSSLLLHLGEGNVRPDGSPMPMALEAWPGGRWFRDLGGRQGHLWGWVQVIKAPTLLEITGPMFMSYAVTSHLSLRLAPIHGGTSLALRHQVLGFVEEGHRQGLGVGWQHMLKTIKACSEK